MVSCLLSQRRRAGLTPLRVLAMRVSIDFVGEHTDHTGARRPHMIVDRTGMLIDLSGVRGSLVDPTIARVDWGPTVSGGEMRDGGLIIRTDGSKQPFWDFGAIKPYVDAWKAKQ